MSKKTRIYFFIISLALIAIFALMSYWVKKSVFQNIDFSTTVRLQNHISRKFDLPFSLFSLLGSVEFTLVGVALIFLLLFWKKKHLFWGISLFFLTLLAELMGKIFIFHPGPPFMFFRYALGFSFPSSYVHTNYSYPSGHLSRTIFIVVIAAFLIAKYINKARNRRLIYLLLFLVTFFMSLSRIYLGEHWLSDVAGGILLGASISFLSLAFW